MTLERRSLCPQLVELRAEVENEKSVLTGYAVRWNSLSVSMDEGSGEFRERVLPGAFTESLQTTDVWAFGFHDEKIVLGRRSVGTLKAVEDEAGLRVLIYPPDSPNGVNVSVAVSRGDLSSMSFGFCVDEERYLDEGGERIREIVKATLHEVSIVVWPAYESTSIKVRSYRIEEPKPSKRHDKKTLLARQRHAEFLIDRTRYLLND